MRKIKKEDLILKISHPLSEDFKISGELHFNDSKAITLASIDFNEKAFQITLDIFNSKGKLNLGNDKSEKINPNNVLASKPITSITNSLDAKSLKRKFNSNLVNPNQKKTKSRGAKFEVNEVEDDKEDEF